MIRGIYITATGMDVQQARVEGTANNLANASTPGYKKDDTLIQSFPEMLIIEQGGPRSNNKLPPKLRKLGAAGIGARLTGVFTDYAQGAIKETGKKTDFYLNGSGFLAVNAPSQDDPRRVSYTRNGALKVDMDGYLATSAGHRVLGEAGEIKVGNAEFVVSSDGTVTAGEDQLGRLRLVEFDDLKGLNKEADDLFADTQGAAHNAVSTTVRQNYLEMSNVNPVDEMVDLIAAMRTYEAQQRLMQAHDELLNKAVNQVGALR